jgi:hypothetical protein
MEYYGLSDKKQYLFGNQYQEMAFRYWGPGNLPQGAQIVGGYSDENRAGALIHLANGVYVCGNAGVISNIEQPPEGSIMNTIQLETNDRLTKLDDGSFLYQATNDEELSFTDTEEFLNWAVLEKKIIVTRKLVDFVGE